MRCALFRFDVSSMRRFRQPITRNMPEISLPPKWAPRKVSCPGSGRSVQFAGGGRNPAFFRKCSQELAARLVPETGRFA